MFWYVPTSEFDLFFFFTFFPFQAKLFLVEIVNRQFHNKLLSEVSLFSHLSKTNQIWKSKNLMGIFREELLAENTIFILPFLNGKPDNWNLQNSQSSWLNWVSRPEFKMNGPV